MISARALALRGFALACLSLFFFARPSRAQTAPPADETPIESMRKARAYFEYGDYASAAKLLSHLIETGRFESAELRGEAYRLLGLSNFYEAKTAEARRAFLEMLFLNPDAELDPFYVPPAAVAYFESVKKDADAQLEPLRKARREAEEARRRLAVAEVQQRERLDQEEEQRRLAVTAPTVEKRVVQREFWVTLLPFGVGQIQNGDRTLGIALATSETIAGATSAGSALLIESLRDSSTGKFGSSVYPLAQRLNIAKWVGAGVFYALWIAGAIQAAVNYQPETQLPDRLVSQSPPSPIISTNPLRAPPPEPLPPPTMPKGIELAPRNARPPLPAPTSERAPATAP